MFKKTAFSFLGILFLLFAYFQWNDPDSMKWIIYYILIAALAFATAFQKNRLLYVILMMGVTLIWMLSLLPGALDWINDGMPSIVESMKASSPYIELVREFLGLGISFLVLVFILVAEKKHGKRSKSL